jgi:methylthioribose-1-phosphate isomerase
MQNLISTALRYEDGELLVLDQRRLPGEELWHTCTDENDLIALIQGLAIRGAPLLGIAAVLWVGHRAALGDDNASLTKTIAALRASRPTAVNLMNYLDRLQSLINNDADASALVAEAVAIFNEDVALCASMAEHGAALVKPNAKILTHCNTGGLATAGIGTAIGVIVTAHRQNKSISVWVDETRPLLQGGRLTAWEMQNAGVPYQIICDNMAASLMRKGEVDMIVVGADRIARNGDFANKVGTYSLAVLAQHHQVPFYVVAPRTTIDMHCAHGDAIPIELREENEVRGVSGSFGTCLWAPAQASVYNPAFDVTPAELVTGWILDNGVFSQDDVKNGALTR